jgi:HEAT repeat protein
MKTSSLPKELLVGMACIFLLAACGARGEDASQTNLMETLVSTNSYSRLSAVKELGAQRGQMIKDLMAILNSTNSDEVKMDAVVVLGEYRAVEAIPFLMDHLDRETNVFPLRDVCNG